MRHLLFCCCTVSCLMIGAAESRLPPPPEPSEWGFREEIAQGVDATGEPVFSPGTVPWMETRLSRCFFGPIKRPPFNRDELADEVDYYPDAYLRQLRDEGVNGLWLTVEFRDLVQTSFNARHPTAERRLAKLRRTIGKCAKYGIGVWLFAIEPRGANLAPELYAAHPELYARADFPEGGCDHLLCPSLPAARRYLKEALQDLFTQAPGLAGFVNISHGECWTTCFSSTSACDMAPGRVRCPRCAQRAPWEVLNDIVIPMRDGIHAANPNAQIITWLYQPYACAERSEWVFDCVRHFPKDAILQYNFESGVTALQEGRLRTGGDYWLAQPGPSDIFRRLSRIARQSGTRLAAKIQVSTSHELATLPYVPVPGLLYRKYRALNACGVRDAMMCWYFGCNPGLMNRAAGLLSAWDFSKTEEEFLRRLAVDWGEHAAEVMGLWRSFSEAYSHYPLSNAMQYFGPFHDGIIWPLHADVDMKALTPTWLAGRPSGDVVGEALKDFTLDEVCELTRKMAAKLPDVRRLDRLADSFAGDRRHLREIGIMQAFLLLCQEAHDVLDFYRLRREAVVASRGRKDFANAGECVSSMLAIVARCRERTRKMSSLCRADARIGFHSEVETYKFYPALLAWRLSRLEETRVRLSEIGRLLSQGNPYPLSEFERGAGVFRAYEDGKGDLIFAGETEAGKPGPVALQIFDCCGSEEPLSFEVPVENGRFEQVVSRSLWRCFEDRGGVWVRIRHRDVPSDSDKPLLRVEVVRRDHDK